MARLSPNGLFVGADARPRCFWCAATPAYQHYHDHEWGFPVDDDLRLFEKLCLEGFQAGLSWLTILNKRDAFRRAFAGFDPERTVLPALARTTSCGCSVRPASSAIAARSRRRSTTRGGRSN